MANIILIMGETGTGKSRSIKNLEPDKTYIVNCMNKDLPFKGARGMYNREKRNINGTNDWETVIKVLRQVIQVKPEITSIIIDDARYIMETEFIRRATEVGYSKFTQLGQHMIEVLNTAKDLGDNNLDVFIVFHTDDVYNGQNKIGLKPKLVGKLVEEHFDPIELATIVLMTNTRMEEGKPIYEFITNRTNIDGVTIPAKSPEEMFPLVIENDLQLVKELIHNYYKEI